MPYQNINAAISPADVQAVKDSFATILAKLPFLVNLTAGERKAIFKAGPDSLSFIQNAAAAAQNNPTIFPASFSAPDFQKDVDLFAALTELGTVASSVASRIDDTRLAVGGEAMQQATQVYNYVKTAAKTSPGLKPVAEQLGGRFQKSRKKGTPPPSA
ncbi:MAG TPA: hypothetical protein VN256_26585 [Pyrinomonadaceae bacterium]|nr:hypothetical protein [Pyrinomonadaceae bacterium]